MRIKKFQIANFKGISKAEICLADDVPGNVCTLIGLNESGKTTILEALSHFVTEDEDTKYLVGTVQPKSSLQDIIPKDQKAAFTGHISIRAHVEIDDEDLNKLSVELMEKQGVVLNKNSFAKNFYVQRTYKFEDSQCKEYNNIWNVNFQIKNRAEKKFKQCTGIKGDISYDTWVFSMNFLATIMPKIVYFPTFLFDFPDKVYIREVDEKNKKSVDNYYRSAIQNILDSENSGLDITKHIVDRIDRVKQIHPTKETLFAFFITRDEKKQIDAVFQKISSIMTRIIFNSWSQIIGKAIKDKRVQIDYSLDANQDNTLYIEMSIIDGQSKYSLSERSLGFRWFFSFLLFTQFKKDKKSNSPTIFVFDEPASNLHSRAQIKLMENFRRIATGDTFIIYSTHSHYMINPLWLEKAYIIENKATDYGDDDDFFDNKKTEITAIKYKTFLGSYPTRTGYFQPALDALQFSLSPLVPASKTLILEGKFDYHALKYFQKSLEILSDATIIPANGASDMGCLINLLRGWGVDFRILLDGDKAGKKAQEVYEEEYLMSSDHVVQIGQICGDSVREFEDLYQYDVQAEVIKMFGIDSPKKKHYSLFFQALLASQEKHNFEQTAKNFAMILGWGKDQFNKT
ncbi:hypothetical protein BH09PAT2_BH09PAT2_11350 [soil metagenome]